MVSHVLIQPDGCTRRDGKRIRRKRLFCDDEEPLPKRKRETEPEPPIQFDVAHLEEHDPDATAIFMIGDPANYQFDSCETDKEE